MTAALRPKLLLALAAPIVVFGAFEIALRLGGYEATPPPMRFPGFELVPQDLAEGLCPMQRHPTRFYQLVPNQVGPFASDGQAFRGGVHPQQHDNLFRVAFIGDSCTMGFGCRYSESFVGIAEQRLRRDFPALDIDAVNAGCAGYSTYQNRLDLSERVLPLSPNLVVLCISAWNDTQGALECDDASWGERFAAAERVSLGNLVRATHLGRFLDTAVVSHLVAAESDSMQATMRTLHRGERPNGARVTPEQFESNIVAMIESSRSQRADVILTLLTTTSESESTDPEPKRYRELARAVASRLGVAVVDVEPLFPKRDSTWFFDPIHPTEEGHRNIGEALAESISGVVRRRIGQQRAPVSSPSVALRSLEPAQGHAYGDLELRVHGSGFRSAQTPRFVLGGEPVELLAIESDSTALLRSGPLPPGRLDLELVTHSGTTRLDAAFAALGPELSVTIANGIARAVVRGRGGDALTLFLATASGDTPRMFGRRFRLEVGSLLPQRFDGVIEPSGEWSFSVPVHRAPTEESKPIFLQAIVEPRSGRIPGLALFTNAVEIQR